MTKSTPIWAVSRSTLTACFFKTWGVFVYYSNVSTKPLPLCRMMWEVVKVAACLRKWPKPSKLWCVETCSSSRSSNVKLLEQVTQHVVRCLVTFQQTSLSRCDFIRNMPPNVRKKGPFLSGLAFTVNGIIFQEAKACWVAHKDAK